MAKTKEQYIIVYDWMTVHLGLSGNERIIYALFYGYCKDGEWCTVSQESIAKRLGASVVGINKAIISLIRKGYIKREEVNGKNGMTYRYMILVNQKTPQQSLPPNKVYPQTKLGSTPKQSWGVTPKQSWGNNKDNNKYNINTTTTNAHTHTHDRLQDEIDEMRGDMIWLEPICMKHHIQLSELDDLFNQFKLECLCSDKKEHQNITDAKQHFHKWLYYLLKEHRNGNGRNNPIDNIERAQQQAIAESAELIRKAKERDSQVQDTMPL